MRSIFIFSFQIFSTLFQITQQQTTQTQFSCYTCTNNAEISQTNINYPNDSYSYPSSISDCGATFNAKNGAILQISCNTSCLKRETGILGSQLDIERRCVKTCSASDSSYSIKNTNPKYIIDRISCCTSNLCNDATKFLRMNTNLVLLMFIFTMKSICK